MENITKRIIAIGGGELKTKQTLEIDRYIAERAREHAGDARPYGLFVGTASHDSMPYFNSFRKTFTSVFDIKADVALTVYGEMSLEKIREKFQKADFIYVGGGDTLYMLEQWRASGLLDLICDAYHRGVIICGLSAGAICWFEDIYTDSDMISGKGAPYSMQKGLGWLGGTACPHYDERIEDFDKTVASIPNDLSAFAIENCAALEFVNGALSRSISCGGKAFLIEKSQGEIRKTEL